AGYFLVIDILLPPWGVAFVNRALVWGAGNAFGKMAAALYVFGRYHHLVFAMNCFAVGVFHVFFMG
ncbi:hypothetical protein ACQWF6_25045, partial [Salmonella enterica subsp. enterica serovar Infantis]